MQQKIFSLLQKIHIALLILPKVGTKSRTEIHFQVCITLISFLYFSFLTGDYFYANNKKHVPKYIVRCIVNYFRISAITQVAEVKAGLHVIEDSRYLCECANILFCKVFCVSVKKFGSTQNILLEDRIETILSCIFHYIFFASPTQIPPSCEVAFFPISLFLLSPFTYLTK